jgi:hypothetical protein
MAKKKSKKRRKTYGGYGNPLRIYSGYGKNAGKVKVSLGIMLPALVGGSGALGGTLLLRALVPPEKKDENGNPILENNVPKLSPFWKYAGLIGGGLGVLASCFLGPFQGWGATVAGAITATMTGLTAQFVNMVVPKDQRSLAQYGRRYRGLGAAAPIPARAGGGRMSVMSGLGRGSGMGKGYGLVYAQDSGGNQTGRTPGGFIPQTVIDQVNMDSFGQATGMGF